MELLDRYLQAVRFWLPKAQQDDIIAELGDDLRSQIEDKESALDRPLTEDELVALLQQSGHPMRVAACYQPQQSLIGPTLFPLYKFVVKVVSLFYLTPWLLVWSGLMIFWPAYRAGHTVLGAWASFWNLAFTFFGVITIVFAVLEKFQSRMKWMNQWDPRKLPRLAKSKDKSRVPRVESVFELAFSMLFIWGWLALPGIAHALFSPMGKILVASPALSIYFWLVLIPTVLSMAQQLINLFRPQWTWLRPPARLVSTALTLAIVAALLKIYPYYTVISVADAKDAAQYARLAFTLNQVSQWSLICLAIGLGIGVIVFAFQTIQVIRKNKNTGGPNDRAAVQISQML